MLPENVVPTWPFCAVCCVAGIASAIGLDVRVFKAASTAARMCFGAAFAVLQVMDVAVEVAGFLHALS